MSAAIPQRGPLVALVAILPLVALVALPPRAGAVRPGRGAGPAARLEAAGGARLRAERTVRVDAPPVVARAAWARFLTLEGDGWRALFDADTGVPTRIFGRGLAAPGAVGSAAAAERHARAALARHLELLAPGSRAEDFDVVTNHLDEGLRTVAFAQRARGLRVLGANVSFRFRADRLFVIASSAISCPSRLAFGAVVSPELARRAAGRWLAASLGPGARVTVGRVEDPVVLPLPRAGSAPEPRVVVPVTVASRAPVGRWAVYLDAATGAPVARRPLLYFGEGTIRYNAPLRHPLAERQDWPAVAAGVLVDGVGAVTSAAGLVGWTADAPAAVTVRARGPLVAVINEAGAAATADFTLDPGGALVWSRAGDELEDAQIAAFVHASRVKAWARAMIDDVPWLEGALQVHVNIDDVCNAYSDGDAIHFFRADASCQNGAQIADVVYHEFGHSLHLQTVLPGVGDPDDLGFAALSEGLADAIAATLTGDSRMGLGFLLDDLATPVRDLAPDRRWPEDVSLDDPHGTGLIVGGALWDLRALLVEARGEAEGVTIADALLVAALRRASDIPSVYVEVLAADDDDGDLANGTPHSCLIDQAFGGHGLAASSSGVPGLSSPVRNGWEVSVELAAGSACPSVPVAGGTLEWRLRASPATAGAVPLDPSAPGRWRATIPPQAAGEVVQYRVTVEIDGDLPVTFPRNDADPWYELFSGEATPLYCTDLEARPPGWTHGLSHGVPSVDADDWQWGALQPGAAASGDPRAAHSGSGVFGNDLGHGGWDGHYEADKGNYLETPAIETAEYPVVRLQYWRWLTIEDGLYDHARITSGGATLWANLATSQEGTTHHLDREWRFHDVDLTPAVRDGAVRVRWELDSDGGVELGGWTIDDVCIVGFASAICGDGAIQAPAEECDDGGTIDGDGCQADCRLPACGDGVVDPGEACDDGNRVEGVEGDDCTNACLRPAGVDEAGPCGCRAAARRRPGPGGLGGALVALAALAPLAALAHRRPGRGRRRRLA